MGEAEFKGCKHGRILPTNMGGPIVPQYAFCFDCECFLSNYFGDDEYGFEAEPSATELAEMREWLKDNKPLTHWVFA
jgi:hypothetical protein